MPWTARFENWIDIVNVWFGSVVGIMEQMAFIIVWIILQFTKYRFDMWPFIGLMVVLTIFSYITNAMLMNRSIRQAVITDTILAHMVSLMEENRTQTIALAEVLAENRAQTAALIRVVVRLEAQVHELDKED